MHCPVSYWALVLKLTLNMATVRSTGRSAPGQGARNGKACREIRPQIRYIIKCASRDTCCALLLQQRSDPTRRAISTTQQPPVLRQGTKDQRILNICSSPRSEVRFVFPFTSRPFLVISEDL
ncbi:hypothetical protein L798_02914 [Zootermopsis nevadensis]|uniref:Secreted protein n=1 Tax=Zootermopsis nevadensis TaxID=136037 RepID=A0A067QJ42_ZOONE|nr:hypothetical protein L798_02914 [Zootermopsis nevadensis]